MPVKYFTRPNPLKDDTNDYTAQVVDVPIITEEDLMNEIVVPGGVTSTQAQAFLAANTEAIIKNLSQGFAVRTKLVTFYPSISGVFNDEDDSFDKKRHSINIKTHPTKLVKEIASKIKVKRVPASKRLPVINKFIDTATYQRDKVITPGLVGEIKGERLKFDSMDLSQGVFLVDSQKNLHRCTKYIRIMPTNIIFYIPAELPAGNIELRVRTKMEGDTSVREGVYTELLSVIQQQQ